MLILVTLSALAWLAVLLAPWRPWCIRERFEPGDGRNGGGDLDVTVLVPARNEESCVTRTLRGLRNQGGGLRILVIDDQSSDRTAELAEGASEGGKIEIIKGAPLPDGWSGKLWALEQGRRLVTSKFVLLLDADIELAAGTLPALLFKLREEHLDLVSVMAELRMVSPWEKLLVPAFVFFFKLLYPFQLANDPRSQVAAAAGGCILLRAERLEGIGGLGAIRGALIDDCTLARRIKRAGGRTWLGLSHSVRSHREYPDLASLWNMVARNAFTQLHYSLLLLLLTSATLLIVFLTPVCGLFRFPSPVAAVAVVALGAMAGAYVPTLRYYSRSLGWVLALPAIGILYLMMTWSSAYRYWSGRRSEWKGRIYEKEEPLS